MHYSQGFFLGLNDFSSSFGDVRDYCKSLSLGAVCREDVFAKMYVRCWCLAEARGVDDGV